jgi:DNA-directed RNA polymerase sigma subunit (sigma70/sigma32)
METALACHEVAEMLNRIGPRERDVLHSWCRGELLKDIAKRMGLSHERTRQIRNKALSQLRGIIAANTRQRHESWLAVA